MDEGSSIQTWAGINGYVPRAPYLEFHKRNQRWAVMVAHRRSGKTVACIADLVFCALMEGQRKQDCHFAYIAPQYNQAKDIAWRYVKRLTEDIPRVQYNETELRADLPNGARIRLYGADNPDRLRGIFLDGVILDEFGDMKPRVWGEVVRPLLADRQGWAAFIGTPKGKNEFWEVWKNAQDNPEWFTLRLPADKSGLLPLAELASAKSTMTEDQYAQEFECSFEAAIVGAFYGKELRQLDQKGHIKSVPYDAAVPVHTAWDLGYSDDTAIWFYQVVRDEIHLLECHVSSGRDLEFYTKLVKSKPYKYGFHWLPHDAKAKTLASGGRSIEEQVSEQLGYKHVSIVPNLAVQDGIQAVRRILPACWFDEDGCADGLEALRQYQREWDEDKKVFRERPRHDWTSHSSDAFRMLAVAWEKEPRAKQFVPIDWDRKPTIKEVFWGADTTKKNRRIT